jgi:5-methylcytosine-specific restriction enzyme A
VNSVAALPGPRGEVLTFCAEDGCTAEVVSGRCPEHQLPSAPREAGGYDRRWRIIRASYLKRHPTCERCKRRAATEVHHLDGRGPRGSNADANLQSCCSSCHSRITATDMWERRRGG